VVAAEGVVPYPTLTDNLHHEVELVVALGRGGSNVAPQDALALVWGYGVGVDLTRRDLQEAAKKTGRPWEWGKAFDASAPCGALRPVSAVGHPSSGRVWLDVNGQTRQQGDLNELIWPVADIISHVSQAVALQPGDLIYTGTPAGVGALQPGDRVSGGVEGVAEFAFEIGARPA
jgi:fumarylpyruvate hydrolase